jgi:site-specific DNA-methyltransferase (adenine-specific)
MTEQKVFLMDCMIGMKEYPDKYFDLAIVDPPYGIGESKKAKSRPNYAIQKNGSRLFVSTARKHSVKQWDNKRPDKEYFDELLRVSKNQIIWGGNHFADLLPARSGWIVWDKVNSKADQSDCELAWTSFKCGVRQIEYMWNGFLQGRSLEQGRTAQGNKKLNEPRLQPAHKPILLYKWILEKYGDGVKTVLDTHVGSGSSRIACHAAGIDFTGFEIDTEYFNNQEERFSKHLESLKKTLFNQYAA